MTEIGGSHIGVGADFCRCASFDHATSNQHRDAISETEDRSHIVLNEDNGG
jgi:hypothetical protein